MLGEECRHIHELPAREQFDFHITETLGDGICCSGHAASLAPQAFGEGGNASAEPWDGNLRSSARREDGE
ncbi:hypothetical protein GCM10020219_103160 [Nonomuraea dietziae]